MELKKRRILTILIAVLAIAVCMAFVPAKASAATKTMKLIKNKNITYYKNGLVKRITQYELYTGVYKYDDKGRITEFWQYDGKKDKKSKLMTVLRFEYNEKGKLQYVFRFDYDEGELYSQEKCGLKVGKKNRILKLRCKQHLSDDDVVYAWTYDSKGRVKKMICKAYAGKKVDVSKKHVLTRSSKGYLKKIVGKDKWGSDVSKFTNKFVTKRKSGTVSQITLKGAKGYAEYHKFKYKKVKVDKKLVKAVKAQQMDMLYLEACSSAMSPAYFLVDMF